MGVAVTLIDINFYTLIFLTREKPSSQRGRAACVQRPWGRREHGVSQNQGKASMAGVQ